MTPTRIHDTNNPSQYDKYNMKLDETSSLTNNHNQQIKNMSVLVGAYAELPAIQHLTRYFDRQLIERACCVSGDVDDHDAHDDGWRAASSCSSDMPTSSSSVESEVARPWKRGCILDEYALIDHGRQLTFGQFRRCYRRLAHLFRTTLVPANRKTTTTTTGTNNIPTSQVVVGVAMQPSIELVVTLFGLLEADCLFVPVDVTLPAERLRAILVDASVSFIICDEHYAAIPSDIAALVNNIYQFEHLVASERDNGDGWDTPISIGLLDDNILPTMMTASIAQPTAATADATTTPVSEQLAAILYTSGSTGTPKGVPLRHASLMNMVQWRMKEMPFWQDEIGVMKSVFTFIDGIIEIFEALLQLRPLVLLTKTDTIDPATLLATLGRHKIYRLAIVPSHLATLLQFVEQNRPCQPAQEEPTTAEGGGLRIIVCDGEVVTPRTVRNTLRLFPGVKVYNIYGTTETCGDNTYVCIESEQQLDNLIQSTSSSSNSCSAEASSQDNTRNTSPTMPDSSSSKGSSVVPIGHSCDNVNVYIVTAEGELAPKGAVGEVYISGIAVANGGTWAQTPPKCGTKCLAMAKRLKPRGKSVHLLISRLHGQNLSSLEEDAAKNV